ncbi:MAG: EAL domain-containing protein, partial [Parasporobacterium sp.]|nr:EAL domain-containing protein [Parasporobacterium sp.]
RSLVSEYEIDPSLLRLEITETVMGTDPEGRLKILNNMRKDGFLIEMDDFGSGYSSMNMLKDMPLDLVKLDMVFLQKSEDVEKAKMIVGTIIRLTRQLGILSLMEGVETDRQYHVLSDMGCQFFQGYYFSRPVPLEEFSENLK